MVVFLNVVSCRGFTSEVGKKNDSEVHEMKEIFQKFANSADCGMASIVIAKKHNSNRMIHLFALGVVTSNGM